jgi:methyl-accepting chemotaxis protein
MPNAEDVQRAIQELNNLIRDFVVEAQETVERYEQANLRMRDVVSAASKLTDDQGGWFFRVAVPADDMTALTDAIQKMRTPPTTLNTDTPPSTTETPAS